MPKSCLRVLETVDSCSYVSQKEIGDETGLSLRSVKSALKRLVSYNLISEFSAISDMRRKIYRRRDENGNK